MDAQDVKADLRETKTFLLRTSNQLAAYLDENNTRTVLKESQSGDENKDYIQQVFKQLRRLEVLLDEALLRVKYILKSETFSQISAEEILFKVYQRCVMEFYSPKNDIWYEEGRALYTNQMSIYFRKPAPTALKKVFMDLEPEFQEIREILDYYDLKHQSSFM